MLNKLKVDIIVTQNKELFSQCSKPNQRNKASCKKPTKATQGTQKW
ncbi:hypothetical protein VPHD249_0086 [Vibrio phage D249]|nr:hypothetical protein SIPHO082v1_p0092 [Vibrio phage 294E48.1]QZI89123.1 hypothetical protein SIPHO042v1_p0126 [Vibrio phage 70E37.1]